MRWKWKEYHAKWLCLCVIGFLFTGAVVVAQKIGDPYITLGVHRKASLPEIRKAYKTLAKEWHPDKNEDPKAESRFVEIKQAYELLSDSERRHAYDAYGITNEDDSLYKQRHDYAQYGRFASDPFEEFFGTRFGNDAQDITLFHKMSITTRHFENNVLEKSVRTPALVFFYSDWCFECVQVAPAWRKLVDAMQPLGINVATVHAGHEMQLARKIGIHGIPSLVFVIDKQVYIYKENLNSVQKILEFIKNKFPYRLVRHIKDSNFESFVTNFDDNKVKALVFEEKNFMRLRYLLTAFYYRSRLSFGFVDMTSPDTEAVRKHYKVERNIDTVILLNEEYNQPLASVSMTEIPTETLKQLIEPNQYLMVPRLSSQEVFEWACPIGGGERSLCVVATWRLNAHTRRALHHTAQTHRARLVHVVPPNQAQLLKALAEHSGDREALSDLSKLAHRLVVVWRRGTSQAQYEWVNSSWPEPYDAVRANATLAALSRLLHRLHRTAPRYSTVFQELEEEDRDSWWWQALMSVTAWAERMARTLRGPRGLSLLSVGATVALILAAGYFVAYLVRAEEEAVQKEKELRRNQKNGMNQNNNEPATANSTSTVGMHKSELRLHELRAEKYNGLVRLLKPGCRTLVLLVDAQSRDQLLGKFHRIVWPYRKNKTLMFAYLMVERNAEWFRQILQLSLRSTEELQINARNAVGTVLALNGHRKYFCIYHAKHPESSRANKRMSRMTRSLLRDEEKDPEAGAFIGFHSDNDSSDADENSQPEILLQENLLDGLENWLDRLFEGTTHRYYINYWPDMTTK